MDTYHNILALPTPPTSPAITIGVFDGIHKGHISLLNKLKSLSKTPVVVTFSNQPYSVLTGKKERLRLCTPEKKLALLEELGIAITLLLSFTPQIAHLTYDQFLGTLHQQLKFSYLVLGKGASFGRGGEGKEERVRSFAKQTGFDVDYLPKLEESGEVISSSRIRALLLEGRIQEAEHLLGRPFEKEVLDLAAEERAKQIP